MKPTYQYSDPRDSVFDVVRTKQNLTEKTGRAAIIILIFAGMKVIFAIGSTAILARLLPPEDQSSFALAMPAVLIAIGLSEFGIPQAIVQRPHITHLVASALFWLGVVAGSMLMIMIAVSGSLAANFFGNPEVVNVFVSIAPYTLIRAITGQYVAILRRQMRIRSIETAMLLGAVIGTLSAIAIAWVIGGYLALVLQLILTELFVLIYLLKITRWLPSSPFVSNFREAWSSIAFGGFLAAERLLVTVINGVPIVVVGKIFTPLEIGLYYRSETIAQLPFRRLIIPMSGAFLPALARLQDDPDAFRKMYIKQVSRGNLIIVAIGILFCSCSDALIWILLGPNWIEAAPIMSWLSILIISGLAMDSLNWCLVSCGKARILLKARLFVSLFIFCSVLVGAQFGVVSLAAIFVLTQIFVAGGTFSLMVTRHTPLDFATLRRAWLGEFLFIIFALPSALCIRYYLRMDSLVIELLIALAFLVCVYSARILLSSEFRSDFKKVFKRVFRSK